MPTFGTLVVLKKGGAPGPHFPIRRRNCVFGSLVECEICIKRDEVQERHARIEVQGVSNFFYILNLANDGGVLINDVAMSGGQKLQLADKDVITICGRKFSIEIPDIVDKENVSENVGLATPGNQEKEKDVKEKEDRPIKNSNILKEEVKKPEETQAKPADQENGEQEDKKEKKELKKKAKKRVKKVKKEAKKEAEDAKEADKSKKAKEGGAKEGANLDEPEGGPAEEPPVEPTEVVKEKSKGGKAKKGKKGKSTKAPVEKVGIEGEEEEEESTKDSEEHSKPVEAAPKKAKKKKRATKPKVEEEPIKQSVKRKARTPDNYADGLVLKRRKKETNELQATADKLAARAERRTTPVKILPSKKAKKGKTPNEEAKEEEELEEEEEQAEPVVKRKTAKSKPSKKSKPKAARPATPPPPPAAKKPKKEEANPEDTVDVDVVTLKKDMFMPHSESTLATMKKGENHKARRELARLAFVSSSQARIMTPDNTRRALYRDGKFVPKRPATPVEKTKTKSKKPVEKKKEEEDQPEGQAKMEESEESNKAEESVKPKKSKKSCRSKKSKKAKGKVSKDTPNGSEAEVASKESESQNSSMEVSGFTKVADAEEGSSGWMTMPVSPSISVFAEEE